MLRRLGLEVLHTPTMRTLPLADADRLRRLTDELIADPPDFLVANTGLGVRSWLAAAEGWERETELLAALSQARIVARGPKAAGAVRSAGLPLEWRSPSEQLRDIAAYLESQGVAGRRVAFQLHGDDHQTLTAELEAAGARVTELPVYRWALPADDDPVRRLIEACCAGRVDAITFTAGPQVRNLLEVAEATGQAPPLLAALNGGMVVGCIGPVCAAVAVEEGITDPVVPDNWRLGSLVRLVGDTLTARRP